MVSSLGSSLMGKKQDTGKENMGINVVTNVCDPLSYVSALFEVIHFDY